MGAAQRSRYLRAMSEPFLGEIRMVGFNFAPRGWALCNGQLLPISSNTALFSLLGTAYGGDGRSTFGLPDLRGRAPVHVGTGAGLSTRTWGQRFGEERHQLSQNEMPQHSHGLRAAAELPTTDAATGAALTSQEFRAYHPGAPTTDMASGSIGNAGANQPHNVVQPSLGIYFVIALVGLFPSRS